ncbi:hypothetical protein OQA88_3117 [Cercophora sp. LCS_1]
MKSQVATLRLIASETTIPVPQIYDYATTKENEINAPYMCMSYIPGRTVGRTVAQTWYLNDPTILADLEHRQVRTLTTLAQYMAQLSQLRFPGIGSIYEDKDGKHRIGPCYDFQGDSPESYRVVASGPYATVDEYRTCIFSRRTISRLLLLGKRPK